MSESRTATEALARALHGATIESDFGQCLGFDRHKSEAEAILEHLPDGWVLTRQADEPEQPLGDDHE